MKLSAAIASAIGTALGETLVATRSLGSDSRWQVRSASRACFLKLGRPEYPFAAEADALRALAAAVRVPQVVAVGTGFLALEWIDFHAHGDWTSAGVAIARLHALTATTYGWSRDNTIGATAQENSADDNWARFYRERRLRPQFELARRNRLALPATLEDRACMASDRLLANHRPAASLLHGDLWCGNLSFDASGVPVLFDPATYYGDAETDLAMARLFGGFSASFFSAYLRERPAAQGWRARQPLYQLYHVLNHANLFGSGYVGQAIELIEAM